MDIYDLLRVLPLASAATWFVLAGLQVYRDRIHTWTETFFLLSCIFAALYATWDFLFFTAGSINFAKFAGLMSTSSAIVTSLDRKSTRLNSSHTVISYAVFCLKKKIQ